MFCTLFFANEKRARRNLKNGKRLRASEPGTSGNLASLKLMRSVIGILQVLFVTCNHTGYNRSELCDC